MAGRLDGKIAVVTGSTSGIGQGIAVAFAREGAQVVVSGRRQEEGERVVRELRQNGGEAVFQPTDLTRPADCQRLIDRAMDAYGGLDILVNNAGIFPRCPLADITPEFWDEVFAVNLRGAFLCCQAAVPHLRARGGGAIINIGSGNAFIAGESLLAYGVSKSALYALTMNLAKGLAADRIRVNWLTVGWVLTDKEFEVQAGQGRDREAMLAREGNLPMGQYNTVEDNAEACVYLASDAAARVTGSELNASAGLRIRL
ncbi:MAG: SDR family oxidoreductase [Armatimonadetes bacterium]|nr:SDR family oxidoreductase [Armatimonadota bacterium]